MLKKNYRYLLTFLSLCSCKDKQEALNKEYVKAMEEKFRSEKENFKVKFSEKELQTVKVPGFFNELKKFDEECKDLKKLRTEIDLAKSILNGFLYLYDFPENTDAYLGLTDLDQKKFMYERLLDAELVLEQYVSNKNSQEDNSQVPQCQYILHRIYFILSNEKSDIKEPQDLTIKKLSDYLEQRFIQDYGSLERFFLTETGENAANKISSLIQVYEDRNAIYEDIKGSIKEGSTEDAKKEILRKALEAKLINIASKILVQNGCILKESDRAKKNFLHPTYLMEVLKSLLRYNTKNGNDRYKEFEIKDDLRKFIFNIIWLALISTSDTLYAEFQPNFALHLKFDNLELQHAFEILALLNYFFDNVFRWDNVAKEHVVDDNYLPDLSSLDFAFRKSDYYYDLGNDTKDLEDLINKKNKMRNDPNRINNLGKIIYEGGYKKTIPDPANAVLNITVEILKQTLYRHIYRNISNGVGDHIYAFGQQDAGKFIQNLEIWGKLTKDFEQKSIPSYFISSLPGSVNDKSVSIACDEAIRNEYFSSLRTADQSLLKETILFTNNMLTKGISIADCQKFKSFAKKVFNKTVDENPLPHIQDVFNFNFKEHGIKVPEYGYTDRIEVKKNNVETIIRLIENNRTDTMTFEEVLMERMLNVCLLKALTELTWD